MARPLQSRSARRAVFPWWTSLVAVGLVLWLRADGTLEAAEGRGSTQLSWPAGHAPGNRALTNPQESASTTAASGDTRLDEPATSDRGGAAGAGPGAPSPR